MWKSVGEAARALQAGGGGDSGRSDGWVQWVVVVVMEVGALFGGCGWQ